MCGCMHNISTVAVICFIIDNSAVYTSTPTHLPDPPFCFSGGSENETSEYNIRI